MTACAKNARCNLVSSVPKKEVPGDPVSVLQQHHSVYFYQSCSKNTTSNVTHLAQAHISNLFVQEFSIVVLWLSQSKTRARGIHVVTTS